jgi:hypothetical protein
MIFKDQSIDDLRVTLIKGNFDTSNLENVVEKEIELQKINIQLIIIGASHAIIYKDKKGKLIFTEIIANYDPTPKTRQQPKVDYKSSNLKNFVDDGIELGLQDTSGLTTKYNILFQKLDLGMSSDRDMALNFATNNNNPHNLAFISFTFPENGINNEIKPRTQIVASYQNQRLTINTIHIYPNTNEAIISQSEVEF